MGEGQLLRETEYIANLVLKMLIKRERAPIIKYITGPLSGPESPNASRFALANPPIQHPPPKKR